MCQPSTSQRLLSSVFCLLTAVLSIGCSKAGRDKGTVPVSGKVTYNGQLVEGATVTFVSDQPVAPGAGMTATDGTYSLRVKPGNYTVTVFKLSVPVDTCELSMEEAMANADKPQAEPKELLPAKYKSAAESPLKFEVKPSGTIAFDLSLSD
jgi:uncharacterized membrane protein